MAQCLKLYLTFTGTGGSSIIPLFVVAVVVVATDAALPEVVTVPLSVVEAVAVVVFASVVTAVSAPLSHATSAIISAITRAINKYLVFILLLYVKALEPRQLARGGLKGK